MYDKVRDLFEKYNQDESKDKNIFDLQEDVLDLMQNELHSIERQEIAVRLMAGCMSNREWANVEPKVTVCYEIADEIIKQGKQQ
jgi:hypothetical protein